MSITRNLHPEEDAARDALERALEGETLVFLQHLFERAKPRTDADLRMFGGVVAAQFSEFVPVLRIHIARAGTLGVEVAEFETIGPPAAFDVETVIDALALERATYVSDLMAFNTGKAIRTAQINHFVDDTSLADFNEAVAVQFGANRAQLVGVTEITDGFNRALLEFYTRSPVVTHYQWLSANDHRVRPICSALSGVEWDEEENAAISMPEEHQVAFGQVRPVGQPFVHPGGGGTQARDAGQVYQRPPAHPGCRCRVIEWRG